MWILIKRLFNFIIESGFRDTNSAQKNNKIALANRIAILSGLLLAISEFWLYTLGVPFSIIKFFIPSTVGLFFIFIISRYISIDLAKFMLIILINITLMFGGLISDNSPRLQQVFNTWIFSTSGILLIIFESKQKLRLFLGGLIILGCHLLFVPIDQLLDANFDHKGLNSDVFVSVSFLLSMVLLMLSIYYYQTSDLNIYKDLLKGLQLYNEKLVAQDEELRQSYEEIRTNREQIYTALEAVNEKKSHLELAMKIAKMGSYHFYFADDKAIWSDELKTMMHLKITEWEKEKYNMYEFMHKDDVERVKNEVNKVKLGLDEYSVIYRVIARNGVVKIVHSAGFVFKNAEGIRLGIRGVLHDITDYKNIETELTETNKELENFIYRAYHDIKGPVATIKGLCYVAALTTNEEVSLHYFGLLKLHMFQLETILSKLLFINELKNLNHLNKPFNGDKLLDEVLISLSGIEGFDKVQFIREIDLPHVVFSDKLMIKIVLQNLIENSFAFKSDNSSWIKVQMSVENGLLVINVSDNGIGIADEYYEKIFERYFRLSEKSKGTGLGLYIVKKLADKLNSIIEVRSMPYIETSFKVIVPI